MRLKRMGWPLRKGTKVSTEQSLGHIIHIDLVRFRENNNSYKC